ncbi:MAG: putative sporulation protein YtxC [Heliobacteriaceae bacterium]|nr:putative sporulation protein YtxC [Heliobacteriaceae bacterium]MDD4587604.1 putative sporulation protein YtxC [Heliobacteriaceae bacterium]
MLFILSIGASRNPDELGQSLVREIAGLIGPEWRLGLRMEQENGTYKLLCYWNLLPPGGDPDTMAPLIHRCAARLVADWIVNVWEPDLLQKQLAAQHYYFSAAEREGVVLKARQVLQQEEKATKEYLVYKLGRRQRITARLHEVFQAHRRLHVDGFIRFRLRDYLQRLAEAMDAAVEEYLLEKEYNEFIRLLRYFLEIQEAKLPMVHVILQTSGNFRLLDAREQPVSNDLVDGVNKDMGDQDVSYEDLLISTLVTVAPEKVVLHFWEGSTGGDALPTIQAVFGDRLHHCPGCKHCLPPVRETGNI